MASLADAPKLVGFFSYSREDDEGSKGKLSTLRECIQEELRGQLGRSRTDFGLWQDKTAIAHGKLWENEITSAVAESVFFIPIITPTAVRSYHCKFEFDSFLAREKELGRNDLVFPILYIPVPALADGRWRDDPLLVIIGRRQYEQWQNLRHLDPSTPEVALRIEKFCANICRALQQPWLSPEEHAQAEARQRVKEQLQHVEDRRRKEETRPEEQKAARAEQRRKILKQWWHSHNKAFSIVGGAVAAVPFTIFASLVVLNTPTPPLLSFLSVIVFHFLYGAAAGMLTQQFGIRTAVAIPAIPDAVSSLPSNARS
jgi:TIR domain